METEVGVFWSYASEDDHLDGGQIVELAGRLADEYALITGTDLRIFVDRDAIEWGDQWRQRIDNALMETTFFIPIVTPRYFTRSECRRELLSFVGQAESLGLLELVLPIIYVQVPGMDEEAKDEVVARVARTQHVDWGPAFRERRAQIVRAARAQSAQ